MDEPLSRAGLYSVAEKDNQYHRTWIEEDLQEILQRLVGVRKWIQFRSAITLLSRFGYFATNSLLNSQTPGEEFCQAELTNSSIVQRLVMILLNNNLRFPNEVPKPFLQMIKDVHMITFFLFGDFYELSKRVTGIGYTGSDVGPDSWKFELLNRFIGCMSIVKLLLNHQVDKIWEPAEIDDVQKQATRGKPSLGLNSDILCQLCSNPRSEPTSTLCGHVFCWSCIHHWLKDREECPVCRFPTKPSRLIHLVNFR